MEVLQDGKFTKPILDFSIFTPDKEHDEKVLKESLAEKAILLTEDKDFGEHVFRLGSEYAGVILVRLPWNGIPEKLKIILECLRTHEENLKDAFTVISPGRVRIRKR